MKKSFGEIIFRYQY